MIRSARPVALVLAALALTPVASAHAGWSQPQSVGAAVGGHALVGADGSADVALVDWGLGSSPARPVVSAAHALPGGAFGTAVPVFASTDAERAYGGNDIGFAADGSGVLLTRRVSRPYPRVRAVFFSADGHASAPRTISSPGHSARIQFDHLAVAPNGRALATWLQYEGRGGGWHLEGAWRLPGVDVFGAPFVLSPRLPSRDVITTADTNDAGDALVTWRSNGRSGTTAASISRRGGPWGPPAVLGPTGFALKTAITPAGAIVVAEQALPADGPNAREELRVLQAAPSADQLTATGPVLDRGCDCSESVENLGLAVSPGGHIAVVAGHAGSLRTDKQEFELRVYEGTAGGALKQTGTLAPGNRGHWGAGIATSDAGGVLAGWTQPVPNHAGDQTAYSRYAVALKSPGGAFGSPALFGQDGGTSQTMALALLPSGGGLAVWDGYDMNSGHTVWASRLTP